MNAAHKQKALALCDEGLRLLDHHLGDSDPIAGPEDDDEFAAEFPALAAYQRFHQLRELLVTDQAGSTPAR